MNPPRTLAVFHVGAHKTGTSLVQKYLRDNATLLRQHRICYLSRGSMNGYIGWGDALLTDPRPLARRMRRIRLDPRYRVLVASHENTIGRPFTKLGGQLYPEAPPVLHALARVLRPYRQRIFLSVRPQADFLESYYLQTIHQGRHHTFQEWLDRIDLDAISWRPLVRTLVETFGRDRVEIVDFRTIKAGQEAYLRNFLTAIDASLTFDIDSPALRNPSVGDKGLSMALAANPYLKSGQERSEMRKFLQKYFSNARYPRPRLLSEEQRSWLDARYSAEYEQLVGAGAGSAPGALAGDAGQR